METICTGRRTRFLEMKWPTTHCFQAQGSNKKRLLLLLMFTQANVFWPAVILSLSPAKYEHSCRKNRHAASYRWHNVWLKCSHDEKCLIVESSCFCVGGTKKNPLLRGLLHLQTSPDRSETEDTGRW